MIFEPFDPLKFYQEANVVPDYNTNAGSYYKDLARKNHLIELLGKKIWEYDQELYKRFLEWDKNLEEFDEEVIRLLNQWLADGVLDEVINQDILNQKANLKQLNDISLNIKDFGAVGDGVTDDTQAIQNTIKEANQRGGGTVIIPPSENPFIFTSIFLEPNVILESTGGVLKFKSGVAIDNTKNYYLIHNMSPLGILSKNVGLVNLKVDGNGRENQLFRVADIVTFSGEEVSIFNCHFIDAPDSGIMFSAVKKGYCVNNTILGGRDVGIYVNDGNNGESLEDSLITGNIIRDFTAGGIALKRVSQRVIVNDNLITDCGNGITLEQASTTNDYSKNMLISGNQLRNILGTCIAIRESDYTLCFGNKMEEFGNNGISLQGTHYAIVTGNSIKSTILSENGIYNSGLLVGSRDKGSFYNIITNNMINILNSQHTALWLANINDTVNKFNIVTNNFAKGYTGLRVDGVWMENIIQSNILDGILSDLNYYTGAVNKVSDNILTNKRLSGDLIGYQNAQLNMGGYYLWIDTKKELRFKVGEPIKDDDGELVVKKPTTVVGTPTGLPKYIGEIAIDTANKRVYVSVGLTNTDWFRVDNTGV